MKDVIKWMNNEPTWLIIPLRDIVNRKQRREYLFEAEKINNVLNNIESSFISFLFDIPNISGYNAIYLKHQEWFKKEVDYFNNYCHLRNIQINEHYFVEKYKPIVNDF